MQRYLFSSKQFYWQLFVLALPIILQNFITSSLNMVDTIMIGHVGETEIAAVGIANQYFFLFNLIIIGIHSGCSVFIAQFWGKKDQENIRKVLGIGLLASSIIAVFFSILAIFYPHRIMMVFSEDPEVVRLGGIYLRAVGISYLFTGISFGYSTAARSIGNTMLPMLVSAFALFCNTLLNYFLIFGKAGFPALGVEGAAIATVIARIIEALLLYVCTYQVEALKVTWQDLKGISREYVAKIMKTILPVVLNESSWGLAFVIYSVVYARISTQAITAMQINNTVQNLFTVAGFGIANAAAVMIGHKIGAGKEEEGEEYAWRFSYLSLGTGVLLGVMLALSAPLILSFFKVSGEVYHVTLFIMYFTALVMPIRVYCIIGIVGILRGGGDVRFSFIAEGITMWFIGVPLAFISAFIFDLNVEYVVAIISIEELTKAIIIFWRLLNKQWIKNLVREIVI